ncbi:MAG: TIGR03013 family PEP-CTERM/XrtA system glycosyltransferase [Haliea sp.]|uniref:TIGR03013 family XrtA/PEP-CTERM system glycosyltransferase n=1 Tax=Haliea sp. TaxID=1932666 RepID=UPI0032EAF8AE
MIASSLLGTKRVFNHHVHIAYYWLALLDAVLFVGACYLATWAYYLREPVQLGLHLNALPVRAGIFAVITVLAMTSMGLYQPRLREGTNGVLLRVGGALLLVMVAMSAIFYLLPSLLLWRGVLAYTLVIAFVSALTTRLVFSNTVELEQFKRQVLVLGSGQRAANIAGRMRRKSDRRGFRVAGYVRWGNEDTAVTTGNVFTPDQSLAEYARDHDIQQIVVALDDPRTLPADDLVRCRTWGIEVMNILDFFEQEASKVLVEEAPAEWFIYADGFNCGRAHGFTKRGMDLLAGFLLLTGTWPLMLVTILAIKLEDGWRAPVIFRQKRVGLDGRTFNVLKFRSMTVDAESDGKARWATSNDARITRVGHIIRKLRIDELPQVINVMVGDMSLVGPRPERPEFVRQLSTEIPFFDKRHCVKPGITGWAQLNYPYGASTRDALHKLEYDLYYVKNRSLFLDFLVLLQTAEVILFGKGAR